MSTSSNKALVEEAMSAWNAGEERYSEWISKAVGPGVKLHVPQGDLTGTDQYRAYYHEIRAAFPDGQVCVDEIVAEGDTVVARYTFSGTNTGRLLTMPLTTGKPASFTVVDVWHVVDGKTVEFWESYDRYGMLEQLGLVREPTTAVAVV